MPAVVIAIGGVTCAGKTTLATSLSKAIENSVLISQDDYYHDKDSGLLQYMEHLQSFNWDLSSAIDMKKLAARVKEVTLYEYPLNLLSGTIFKGKLLQFAGNEPRCTMKLQVRSEFTR